MDNKQIQLKKQRIWTGVVVSNKMDKTVVVKVESVKVHPVYGKRYVSSKKYKVHAPGIKPTIGKTVQFIETKPISKDKKWILVGINAKDIK